MTRALFAPTPGFLGYDVALATKEGLEQYCEKVIELSPLVRQGGCFRVVIGDQLVGALADCGRYPYAPPFRAALAAHNLDSEFSAEDLIKLLHRTLQLGESHSALFGVEDMLTDTDPVQPPPQYPGCDQLVIAETSLYLAWALSTDISAVQDGTVVCYSMAGHDTVKVDTTVTLVQPDGLIATTPPYVLKRDLRLVIDDKRLPQVIDAKTLWDSAETSQEIAFALSVAAYNCHTEGGGSERWSAYCNFLIGSRFIESLVDVGAYQKGHRSSVVFEACARAIAGNPKYEMKKFDCNDRDDGATAHRIHITKHHEALRLMLWQLPDGRFELANVGVKAEEEIYHGDASAAFSLLI